MQPNKSSSTDKKEKKRKETYIKISLYDNSQVKQTQRPYFLRNMLYTLIIDRYKKWNIILHPFQHLKINFPIIQSTTSL